MKILITGSTGLLGQALTRRLARSADVIGLSRHALRSTEGDAHVCADLTDAVTTEHAVATIRPDVVIHTQALSDVDRCEVDPPEAERMNVQTTEHLCHALRASEALLVAMSSDYVFDGVKTQPYDEADEPRPLSVYGRSKLAAERTVLRYPRGLVIRPSTLFGPGRTNFCSTIVKRVVSGQAVEAFVDQTTSPTYTDDLAEGIEAVIEAVSGRSMARVPRIYHLANARGCRRIEFATRVCELLNRPTSLVRPIRMEEQRRPAKRPAYTVLTSRHIGAMTGRMLRPWDEALQAYLRRHH